MTAEAEIEYALKLFEWYREEMRRKGLDGASASSSGEIEAICGFILSCIPVGKSTDAQSQNVVRATDLLIEWGIAEVLRNPALPILWIENKVPIRHMLKYLPRYHHTFWRPQTVTHISERAPLWVSRYPEEKPPEITFFTPLPEYIRAYTEE